MIPWFVRLVALPFFALILSPTNGSPPNVLFILVDDWGWMDCGYSGSTFHETPEIDKLAAEWTRFDACYAASPMCSPTRLSILNGRAPARHGVTQWLKGSTAHWLPKGESPRVFCPLSKSTGISTKDVTLGEAFQEGGYETAFYGKWHMGSLKGTGGPARHGFDESKAIIEANRCSMFAPFRGGKYFPKAKPGETFSKLLADEAIRFISREREQPFYLHLCHFAMHAPIESPADRLKHFQAKRATLPPLSPDRELDPQSHKPQKIRQDNVHYAGELADLDEQIGPHYQGEGAYPASAIRKGRWKLVHNYHSNTNVLYDLAVDPAESKNLALEEAERVEELKAELDAYLLETSAVIPKPTVRESNP